MNKHTVVQSYHKITTTGYNKDFNKAEHNSSTQTGPVLADLQSNTTASHLRATTPALVSHTAYSVQTFCHTFTNEFIHCLYSTFIRAGTGITGLIRLYLLCI